MCAHLIICHVKTNFFTSNLPSLKRAGAVLFREVLPTIVSFERVISTGENREEKSLARRKQSRILSDARAHHVGMNRLSLIEIENDALFNMQSHWL